MKYDDLVKKDTGYAFFSVRTPQQRFGTIEPVDGGFLAVGCRKPVATLDEAVEQLLRRYLRGLQKEMRQVEALLERKSAA